MPGTAARTLVADDDDIAGLHPPAQDRIHRVILAFEHHRGTLELQNARVNARGLHDTAALGQVAVEDREAAVLAVGGCEVADAAASAVQVQLRSNGSVARTRSDSGHRPDLRERTPARPDPASASHPSCPAPRPAMWYEPWARMYRAVSPGPVPREWPSHRPRGAHPRGGNDWTVRLCTNWAPCATAGRCHSSGSRCPPSCAAANRCSTVLVEPPMAISSDMAFSKAALLAIFRGRASTSSCS